MNVPLPSIRAFLSDIPSLPTNSKIRFLGCVRTYNIPSGHLILEHNYPYTRADPPTISVDISALLELVTSKELHVGAWINVLGYVRDAARLPLHAKDAAYGRWPVYVEAVMIFSAGAVALGEYERTLKEAQNVDRRLGRTGQAASSFVSGRR